MKLKLIRVTKSHIAKGKLPYSTNCPVALALTGAGYRKVKVQARYFEASGRLYGLPDKVRNFIEAFDSGVDKEQLKPFTFRPYRTAYRRTGA